MSEPFLAEVRIMGFNFAPRGWAVCDGQLLPINQYQALFSLLGVNFGGDGRTTFALPDLRGRVPIQFDMANPLGAKAGQEVQALTTLDVPSHTHEMMALTADAQSPTPGGQLPAHTEEETYAPATNPTQMAAASVGSTGSNQPHENMQPNLVVNFCIALQGLFPSRN